jgi:hypothetical protein
MRFKVFEWYQEHKTRRQHDLEAARREREISQQRLDDTHVAVIIPLRELRAENHITSLIQDAIRKRQVKDKKEGEK